MQLRMSPKRFVLERRSMAASRARLVLTPDGRLCWHDVIRSNLGNEYDLILIYPARFPHEPIQAVIAYPELPEHVPHRFRDGLGTLCLFGDHTDMLSATAGVARTRTALWVLFYENWLQTGEWPNDWQ